MCTYVYVHTVDVLGKCGCKDRARFTCFNIKHQLKTEQVGEPWWQIFCLLRTIYQWRIKRKREERKKEKRKSTKKNKQQRNEDFLEKKQQQQNSKQEGTRWHYDLFDLTITQIADYMPDCFECACGYIVPVDMFWLCLLILHPAILPEDLSFIRVHISSVQMMPSLLKTFFLDFRGFRLVCTFCNFGLNTSKSIYKK